VAKTLLTHFLRLTKWEGVEAKLKEGEKKNFWSKPKAHAGWPKRVKLVWATPRAEVDVIGVH